MPVVHVEMFPGPDTTAKGFIARGITDVVSEIAGMSREGVHVIFDEVPKENWAIGPRLTSTRTTPVDNSQPDAHVSVSTVKLLDGKREEYLTWRRYSVYPFMAGHDGFLGSTLLQHPEEENTFIIINKWRDAAAQESYVADPRETQLRTEAKEFLAELSTGLVHGAVVDVWRALSPSR